MSASEEQPETRIPPISPKVPERQSEETLRKLMFDLVDGRIFVIQQLKDKNLANMVFMPLVFGALEGFDLDTIGTIYEYYSEAGPRSINGYPCFFGFRMLHIDDWRRVLAAAEAETARRENVAI